jgi:competence protein ComFC
MRLIGRLASVLGGLVFPRLCPGCGQLLSGEERVWCLSCGAALAEQVGADYCPRCGLEAKPYLTGEDGCPVCRRQRWPVDGFARVGAYEWLLRNLIGKYKFGRRQEMDRLLAEMLADAVRGSFWGERIEAIVPVPGDWRDRFRYRFYPVGLLAEGVGRELGIPVYPLVGVRGKKRRQLELPESERPGNVRGVFYLRAKAQVRGMKLCILDDVSTTGSTLKEIARLLKESGAKEVYAATLAKTRPRSG